MHALTIGKVAKAAGIGVATMPATPGADRPSTWIALPRLKRPHVRTEIPQRTGAPSRATGAPCAWAPPRRASCELHQPDGQAWRPGGSGSVAASNLGALRPAGSAGPWPQWGAFGPWQRCRGRSPWHVELPRNRPMYCRTPHRRLPGEFWLETRELRSPGNRTNPRQRYMRGM